SSSSAASTSSTSYATWCMPGPRLARNFPTGVSPPSAASSSTRPEPTRIDAASTPCSGTAARCSTRAPSSRSYVPTASSRSATATPRWWIPRGSIAAMLPAGPLAVRDENLVDQPVLLRLGGRHEAVPVDVEHHLLDIAPRVVGDDLGHPTCH